VRLSLNCLKLYFVFSLTYLLEFGLFVNLKRFKTFNTTVCVFPVFYFLLKYLNIRLEFKKVGTVGGQIKLGHLKFNLCKSDH
jgi:hypothetical protein